MNKISLSAEAQRDLQDIKRYISVELDNITAFYVVAIFQSLRNPD